MTKCKIEFKPEDKFDKFVYNQAKPVVVFIMHHMDFLECLCDGLVKFVNYDSINEIGRRGKNKFHYFLQTYDFEDDKSCEYIGEFEEIFRQAYDIKSTYQKYSKKELQDKLGEIRGKILELLIEEFVKDRYKGSRNNPERIFSTGCTVIINQNRIVTENRITIDIAGWDGEKGEFYETKVGPQNFNEDVLKLLSYIKYELDSNNLQTIVGCVSMANKDKLEEKIDEVKRNIQRCNTKIEIIGKRELVNLIEEPFSSYA